MDGQKILLNEFYVKCLSLFPQCSLFEKFYYWQSEIRKVVSNTENGMVKHKTRRYQNCLSTFCPKSCDPRKTHGDVVEYYDQIGNFMGIAVYMGDGKYCSLPFRGYKKWNLKFTYFTDAYTWGIQPSWCLCLLRPVLCGRQKTINCPKGWFVHMAMVAIYCISFPEGFNSLRYA